MPVALAGSTVETSLDVKVALVGLVNSQNKVLLARTCARPDVWQPIGGHVEQYDFSPADAAVREIDEETGIRVSPYALKAACTWPSDTDPKSRIQFYTARVDVEPSSMQEAEILELAWVPVSTAYQLPALPATSSYLRLLAIQG